MGYEKNLKLTENKYNENRSVKNAIILVEKYRTAYKISNKNIYIKKGLATINERMAENNLDAGLILYNAYFSYLDGETQESKRYLKIIKQGKNYYKENNINLYLRFLYIETLVENNFKNIKILSKFSEKYKIALCYMADIFDNKDDLENSYKWITASINSGLINPIIYQLLYKYFNTSFTTDNNKLIFKLLRWCYFHNIDFKNILHTHKETISFQVKDNIDFTLKIYSIYEDDYILKKLCEVLIEKGITDQKAFLLYLKASKKQINIKELNKMLILTSYENGYENISYFFMKNFLKEEKISDDIKGYIYHLLINNETLSKLQEENNKDIISYCIDSVDKKREDLYHFSIYKYCLLNQETFKINLEYVEKMENILFENLFNYEIKVKNNSVNLIGIKENEKKELNFFPVNNNTSIVKSSTSEINYYFFENNTKNIIKEIPLIKALVYSLDIEIYIYFYNRGKRTPELLVTLSNYFLNNSINKNILLNILKDTTGLEGLTDEYLNKLNLFIGSAFLSKKEYYNALEYFQQINNVGLTGDYVEKLLIVFLETENYQRASSLLISNRYKISHSIIIYTLEKLSVVDQIKKDRELIKICYEMILKGSFNIQLINLVLKEYTTTLDELINFYKIIMKKNIFNKTLAEKIIYSSIKNRVINDFVEEVFVKYYEQINLEKTTIDFLKYLAYEVLRNKYVVKDSTLKVLEEIYKYNKLALFTLTLSYYYKNIKNYDIIKIGIEEMEKDQVFFPVLKENFFSDYGVYVNKYQPFIYYSEKNKTVYLHYKFKTETSFIKEAMTYFKFGIFMKKIIMFFNEEIEYYFEEIHESGSITSEIYSFTNKNDKIYSALDEYTIINNAHILKEKSKFNDVENIITSFLVNNKNLVGQLLEGE